MTTLKTCPTSNELRALSLGQLSEERSDEMLGHLRICEPCQAELGTSDQMDDTLLGHLRDAAADESFSEEDDCRFAMAKALGALANAENQSDGDSEVFSSLPKILGEYEVVRPIGRGGMGSVYLARHSKLGRQVALKVLSSHRLMQPSMRQRFETEMRAVGQLSHPNIVTAHDARDLDELAVLVTEYIDGLDVSQILRRTGKLPVADACEIARQMALALEYIDEQGLVHRDIKPSNIMVGKTGEVKLLDLGLARLQLDDDHRPGMTATGQTMGTADYIAPEQVNDSRSVDIRADIYSLGCTLFKMLTGQSPFDDDRYPTAFAKMTAHVSDSPPPLESLAPEIPGELGKLVHRMIAKDANDRPQAPAAVAAALAEFSAQTDLKRLVGKAVDSGDIADPSTREANSDRAPSQANSQRGSRPQAQPFFRRRVSMLTAVASGLLGTLLGLMLGVVITINHPDGTKSRVEAPNGSSVKVAQNGNVEIRLPGGDRKAASQSGDASDSARGLTPGVPVKDRLQGVWLANALARGAVVPSKATRNIGVIPAPASQNVMAFVGDKVITFFGDQRVQVMTFDISIKKNYSMLNFQIPGANDLKMQAIVEFNDDDEFTMRSNGATDRLQRIADLPVTEKALKRIEGDPNTALFLKSVRMIAVYNKTGKLPLTRGTVLAREAALKPRSQMNLRKIGIALHNFHDAYRTLPAAHTDQRGDKTVARSWRVAILPFMGEDDLYKRFQLDESWDSEHNLKLLDQMPKCFRAPRLKADPARKMDLTETPYLAIVGSRTVISYKPTAFKDITDGLSRTIMVVETKKTVPWTKPEDLTIPTDGELPELEAVYKLGFHALTADGAIPFIKSDTDPKDLRAFFTRDGHEIIKLP